jgi:hypothetical protein
LRSASWISILESVAEWGNRIDSFKGYRMDLQIHGQANNELPAAYRQVLVPWSIQGGLNPPVITRASGCYFFDQDDNQTLPHSRRRSN